MKTLIEAVETARKAFINSASSLRFEQYTFKPAADHWSIVEIVEHMYWAEQIGINGMWKALDGIKNKRPIWEGKPEHQGRKIEEVVAMTWQTKEQVPDVARPRWGCLLYTSLDAYNAINRRVSQEYGLRYFNITPISRLGLSNTDLVAGDELHPSGYQYTLWVRAILTYLDERDLTTLAELSLIHI